MWLADVNYTYSLNSGVTLDEGKRYTQTVECSFHVSMAAVEPKTGSNDVVSVYINQSDADFLICTLKQGSMFQQTLDLGFVAGETITLFTSGKGILFEILFSDFLFVWCRFWRFRHA